MLAFNHLLAGSVVALTVPAPLVPLVAFTSHFVLDLFPHAHGEEPPYSRFLKTQITIDFIVSIATLGFLLWLFPDKLFIVGVGAFFGFVPDALWLLWRKGLSWLDRFLDFAHWIQWGERPYGWLFDAFYGFLLVFTLLALAGKV